MIAAAGEYGCYSCGNTIQLDGTGSTYYLGTEIPLDGCWSVYGPDKQLAWMSCFAGIDIDHLREDLTLPRTIPWEAGIYTVVLDLTDGILSAEDVADFLLYCMEPENAFLFLFGLCGVEWMKRARRQRR